MGKQILIVTMPPDYTLEELKKKCIKKAGKSITDIKINKKSLDARRKGQLKWNIQVTAEHNDWPEQKDQIQSELLIPGTGKDKKVIIMGSGPAGLFAALVLVKSGASVTILERGKEVEDRINDIETLDNKGLLNGESNYCYGEGGAGTFSDGKLTSRSKHISKEKFFILQSFVRHGAPEEILYLNHPHVGSDKLQTVIPSLRRELEVLGVNFLFESTVTDIKINQGSALSLETEKGLIEGSHFILAPGHSAYDTYRWLLKAGLPFRPKNFAIGMRAEHPQEVINEAQWGSKKIEGLKAAEYRLTSHGYADHPVYSFCMCPGGIIVPSSVLPDQTIVNGMSQYKRNSNWANAAVVAGLHPEKLLNREMRPEEVLDWLYNLEQKFSALAGNFKAPVIPIKDFIKGRAAGNIPETSYSRGVFAHNPAELFPLEITEALRQGLRDFSSKLKGYEEGWLVGLESKTSSPLQVVRETGGLVEGFLNLYIAGEGSGWSGGIISSGADGIRCAMDLLTR